MTATNHDDQLGEIYPTMLNELNCTSGVSFSRLCELYMYAKLENAKSLATPT